MSDGRQPEATIDDVIGQAVAAETVASPTSDDFKALANRVDLLTADIGRWESYKAASAEYVAAFKKEVDWYRRIRLAVAVVCCILVLFLAAVLVCTLVMADQLPVLGQPYALTALIVATITGCVVVTIAITKGAFATMADRNAGLPMPEHVKELAEVGRMLVGNGNG